MTSQSSQSLDIFSLVKMQRTLVWSHTDVQSELKQLRSLSVSKWGSAASAWHQGLRHQSSSSTAPVEPVLMYQCLCWQQINTFITQMVVWLHQAAPGPLQHSCVAHLSKKMEAVVNVEKWGSDRGTNTVVYISDLLWRLTLGAWWVMSHNVVKYS